MQATHCTTGLRGYVARRAVASKASSTSRLSAPPLQVLVAPARLHNQRQPFLGSVQQLQAEVRAASAARQGAVRCNASLMVKDDATGIEFPLVNEFWAGETYRSVGAGARSKKIAFINVKVYAVTVYVEAEKAAKELGVRQRGGFFDDNKDDDYALALVDGAFDKVVQIEMARSVDGATFVEALNEALEPRMRLMGEMTTLEQFKLFFMGKTIDKGSNIILLWRQPDSLEMTITTDKSQDFSKAIPDLVLSSAGLCRALFEVYLGAASVVPEAKGVWARGARGLLESEQVKRDTRKG